MPWYGYVIVLGTGADDWYRALQGVLKRHQHSRGNCVECRQSYPCGTVQDIYEIAGVFCNTGDVCRDETEGRCHGTVVP